MQIKRQLDILTIINEESNSGNQSHCEKNISQELGQIPKLVAEEEMKEQRDHKSP